MKYFSVACLEVKDYKKFKNEFDGAQDLLRKWGFTRSYINRNVDDPKHLIIVHECSDLKKAREFYKSADFKQCIAKAGITGKPEVTFMEELARTPELATVS